MKSNFKANGIVLALVMERGFPVLLCRNVLPCNSDFLCTMCYACATLYGRCELRYTYPASKSLAKTACFQLRSFDSSRHFYIFSKGTGVSIEIL